MGTHPIFESDFDCLTDCDKMFELVTMKDDVKIEPHNFGDAIETAVEKELNRKLANKVYHNHGLCIILYDILEIGDSLILPGDGACYTFVKFRFVMFRPFLNEVLIGKVRSCTAEGLRVSVDFFDDIFVPKSNILMDNEFRHEGGRQKWALCEKWILIQPFNDLIDSRS